MAYIDDLIAGVPDPDLRRALAIELARIKGRTSFGLVFERHIPETGVLPGLPLHKGSLVVVRDDPQRTYVVEQLNGSTAVLREQGDSSSHEAELKDLLVVSTFGRPIYPALTSLGSVQRSADRPFHAVVNGENYHALQLFTYVFSQQVDCIYIDPPYNTGASDWTYNNRFVDGNDSYRHSKWLSMMEKRLRLAKRLLSPDGVMVVTIDEHELSHLGMLLETLFPDAVRQLVTIVINPLGQARKQELARVEEYAFFLFFGKSAPAQVADDLLTEAPKSNRAALARWERLIRGGTGARRQDSPRLFFPVFIDPIAKRIMEIGEALPEGVKRDTITCPEGLVAVWPLNTNGQEGRWRCSPSYLRELSKRGYAKVGAYDAKNERYSLLYLGKAQIARIESGEITIARHDENGVVVLEGEEGRQRLVTPKTVWNRPSHRAGEYGSALQEKFIPGRDFPFPKSIYAVLDTLRIACGGKPDALILDFFAGSGTTLHSTFLLNAEDGGTRRCVLVTNNEVDPKTRRKLKLAGHHRGSPEYEQHGIFEAVTRPRCEAVITGMRTDGSTVEGAYLDGQLHAEGFRGER